MIFWGVARWRRWTGGGEIIVTVSSGAIQKLNKIQKVGPLSPNRV